MLQVARAFRVLFLGNSYTYYNDLPGIVRALGEASGIRIDTVAHTHGGMSLQGQLHSGRAVELVRGGGWDAVVLQDQSLRPVRAPALTRLAARRLHTEVAAVGARTVFYLTWAREALPEQQPLLDHTYRSVARELGAEVAPAGPAWRRVRAAHADVALYGPDGSHPAPAGSYLAAAVLFGRLTGRSPVGLPVRTVRAGGDGPYIPRDLPEDVVARLQAAAWGALGAEPDPSGWPADPHLDPALAADPDVAALQEVPLLYDLTAEEIGGLLAVCPRRRLPPGSRLDEAAAHILLAGRVGETAAAGQVVHDPARLGLALTLGREALLGRASAVARTAATEATVVSMGAGDLAALAQRAPATAEKVRRNLGAA